ncbi:MAG TPA: NFACT RNA binding domain-containing protein [Candidatus Syntrophosphaera sp.]|nr:NFACT RNA binding domain-containing protein [Candidatus Syntrophosphaera sp.]
MKYQVLAGWVRESSSARGQVENVTIRDDRICLNFKGGKALLLYAGQRDAYCFWTDDRGCGASDQSIWPQLRHAQLLDIRIAEDDRVVFFHFELTDIYQQTRKLTLIAEFSPSKPNLILVSEDQGLTVVDALRKYSYADNPQRQILPHLPYQAPRTSFTADKSELGLPLVLADAKLEVNITCDSCNSYLQNHYQLIILASEREERLRSSRQRWERELRKTKQKLTKQETELAEADQAERWQICAETLKHNLQNIAKGQTSLSATNYFDPELKEIEIPLQADKSPQQNLQAYLKKYHKAKRGLETIRQNLEKTRQEVKNLENVLDRLDSGEFVEMPGPTGLSGLGRKLDILDKLLRLRINEDFEIVVGRKARENDFVTTQLAQPHDWWFHTRIYRGSHILLRCFRKTDPSPELLNLCCSLAAWYSKARFSINVPVDYTQVRYVRKPRKSAPGFVTYTSHHTVFAEPKDLRTVRSELKL